MPSKPKEPWSHILMRKHLTELGLVYSTEIRFHPERNWRWDFTLDDHRIAIEIQGSIWKGKAGGHTSGFGAQRDMDKRNAGVMQGWRVLTFSTEDVLKGKTKAFLKHYLDKDIEQG